MFLEDTDDPEVFIVAEHISLESARKDIQYGTGEPYTGEADQLSEWQIARALADFEVGQEITMEQFHDAVNGAIFDQAVEGLIEKGMVDAVWDEEIEDMRYFPSKKVD